MKNCPICNISIADDQGVCRSCLNEAILAEPGRQRKHFALLARRLMLVFAIVLLLITLGMVLSFLAGPIGLLKKTGTLRVAGWAMRSVGRGLAAIVRLAFRGRRRRVRRRPTTSPRGHLR